MIEKIKYVYGLNKEGEKTLLGARVFSLGGNKINKQGIYVGQIVQNTEFSDYKRISNPDNARMLYFPQCDSYVFLKEKDKVLPWIDNDSISEVLDAELVSYRENELESKQENSLRMKNLDMEDPFIELYDLPLTRVRCSDR